MQNSRMSSRLHHDMRKVRTRGIDEVPSMSDIIAAVLLVVNLVLVTIIIFLLGGCV